MSDKPTLTIEDLGERVRKLEQALASGEVTNKKATAPLPEGSESGIWGTAPLKETPKIPKLTAICLSVLCILAIGTGVRHWHATYLLDEATPALSEINDFDSPDDYVLASQTNESFNIPRPVLEPRPQFIELWESFGKNNIVGHLFIEGTDLDEYVLQSERNENLPSDWVFVCHQVDILMGDALNWVIHGPPDSDMQRILSKYFEYDFFLQHPVITFNTQYAEYEWEVFSFYIAPMDFPFAMVNHPRECWGDMVETFTMAGLYNTRLDVTEHDQILTLTTPVSSTQGLYYVLQARLLRHITS